MVNLSSSTMESMKTMIKIMRVKSYINAEKKICLKTDNLGDYWNTCCFYDTNTIKTYYPWIFSKCLEHNCTTGMACEEDIDKLLDAIKCPTEDNINCLNLSSTHTKKIVGLTSPHSSNLIGCNPNILNSPNNCNFDVDDIRFAFEMLEVYAQNEFRSVPFSKFEKNDDLIKIIKFLNSLPCSAITAPKNVNSQIDICNLFRGNWNGELIGPYISQFLLLPFNLGNICIDQKYIEEIEPENQCTMDYFVNMQNCGHCPDPQSKSEKKYIYNGNVLGSAVHNDPLYQFYYQAALIAVQNKIFPDTFDSDVTTQWIDGGVPFLYAAVAEVSMGALRVAWYNKFCYNLKIRPEAFAARIELALNDKYYYENIPKMKTIISNLNTGNCNLFLNYLKKKNGSYFLKQLYPEGSPVHPTRPAGHATVAGACCTVLKAILKTHKDTYEPLSWPLSEKKIASCDGVNLDTYVGEDAEYMTINGELNKLASNISLGRDWAGVHYRNDGKTGMLLGEEYAIEFLIDKFCELYSGNNGMASGWILEKFDGTTVRINQNGCEPIS